MSPVATEASTPSRTRRGAEPLPTTIERWANEQLAALDDDAWGSVALYQYQPAQGARLLVSRPAEEGTSERKPADTWAQLVEVRRTEFARDR